MARSQSAALDRKKLMADPIMVTTIVVLITVAVAAVVMILLDAIFGGILGLIIGA